MPLLQQEKHTIQTKNKKKPVIILIGVILLIVAIFAGYKFVTRDNAEEFSGPTAQDIKDAQDNKKNVEERKRIEEEAKNASPDPTQKRQVSPQIINASQSGEEAFVSASISGVFEDGGVCTLTATQGSRIVTKTAEAFADATTTSCTPFRIPVSEFANSGNWSVVIDYKSSAAEGVSQATELVIQ